MERTVGKNEKLESFAEFGKSQAKLERTQRSWKEPSKVGKLLLKLENFGEVGKFLLKLEREKRNWKEPSKVGKFR